MSDNKQTQIKTSLPYCLYRVDSRVFELGDKFKTKIKFTKVETTPNRRIQSSQNVEIIRDRWGIDAHSDVEIYTDKSFADQEEAEVFTLELINDFVRRYKYYDKSAVHLVPLTKEDLLGLNILSNGHGVMSVSFAGGITITNPSLNREISNKIEKSIISKEEIPFWQELLLNAEQYLYQTDNRHSILESVIALELVTSKFIWERCHQKGILDKKIKEYIYGIGITGNIEVTLRLLLEEKQLPDQEILNKCSTSIRARNSIVHKGRKSITEEEARDSLEYSRKLIEFLIQV